VQKQLRWSRHQPLRLLQQLMVRALLRQRRLLTAAASAKTSVPSQPQKPMQQQLRQQVQLISLQLSQRVAWVSSCWLP
jgi:hypothetical protein